MIIRYIAAITSGTFITLTLFYVMQTLIDMEPFGEIKERERAVLTFTRLLRDTPVDDRPPPPIDRFPEVIEFSPPVSPADDFGDFVGVRLERPDTPETKTEYGIGQFLGDGPLVAVVRVQPTYPARAAERELEGWVIVQFDVNADGTVSNAHVVSSSHTVFENAAIKAALRFRYKAKVVDGVPLSTTGVQNKFTFEIDRG